MSIPNYPQLALPPCQLQIREGRGGFSVYDECRMLWVAFTPEEWVRQHVLHYLLYQKSYPRLLIHVEERVMVNGQPQRADIVVYGRDTKPFLLIECKAAHIAVGEDTIWQVATYNSVLKAAYFAVTNGMGIGVFQTTDTGVSYWGTDFPKYPKRETEVIE